MAARRKEAQWPRWLFAFLLTGLYLVAIVAAVPFLAALSASPPWGWLMLFGLLYFAFGALSILTHLWGINLRTKILFIPF
jgi:hypothetical protein